jgi:hypothetical protein
LARTADKRKWRDSTTVGEGNPLVLKRLTLATTDGAQVAGDIVQILPTGMEAGLPTEVATGGGVSRQHNNANRQGEDGVTHKRPNHALERDGEAQETTTQRNYTDRQEGDGATDNWQRNGQERDGVDPTQTAHPGTPDQTPQATDPT